MVVNILVIFVAMTILVFLDLLNTSEMYMVFQMALCDSKMKNEILHFLIIVILIIVIIKFFII